jgi:toxin-antitoxin system PIN domain toxin
VRSLLDANVLIAYFDQDHAFHERAYGWFVANRENGWASSPLTENAVIRILTNPNYSIGRTFPLSQLIAKFNETIELTDHEFWPDDISLFDSSIFDSESILGPRQLTDIYLLAVAVKNRGRLVTFDAHIAINAVNGATKDNLYVL